MGRFTFAAICLLFFGLAISTRTLSLLSEDAKFQRGGSLFGEGYRVADAMRLKYLLVKYRGKYSLWVRLR